MLLSGIALQRISLGALIVALGLLVDDAMITVEMMIAKLEDGVDRIKAASYAYTTTAFPMLTGTIVTAAGFIPVGFARSDAGEYSNSMFWVLAVALLASWVVAILFSPLIGVYLLPKEMEKKEHVEGRFTKLFRRTLLLCLHRPYAVIGTTVILFGFFPSWEPPSGINNSFQRRIGRNSFSQLTSLKTHRYTRLNGPSTKLLRRVPMLCAGASTLGPDRSVFICRWSLRYLIHL